MKYSLLFLSVFLCISCATPKTIIDKPIKFDQQREHLTKEYLKDRYDITQETSAITPRMIVLHWTEIPTLNASFNAFDPITLPQRPELTAAGSLNVSAHFLVDQDGSIYRLMPETTMARHVIGLNHCAIGIENVGGTQETPLTEAQIKSNIWLVQYLAKKYPIEYLIGHYEYTNFEHTALWMEVDDGYRTQKTDPGIEFLNAVKKGTKKINFKATPQ